MLQLQGDSDPDPANRVFPKQPSSSTAGKQPTKPRGTSRLEHRESQPQDKHSYQQQADLTQIGCHHHSCPHPHPSSVSTGRACTGFQRWPLKRIKMDKVFFLLTVLEAESLLFSSKWARSLCLWLYLIRSPPRAAHYPRSLGNCLKVMGCNGTLILAAPCVLCCNLFTRSDIASTPKDLGSLERRNEDGWHTVTATDGSCSSSLLLPSQGLGTRQLCSF